MDITDSRKDYEAPQARKAKLNVSFSILGGSADKGAVTIDRYTEDILVW